MNHLFCFGLGYSAGVLAERFKGRGWLISGTSTSQQGVEHIHAAGYQGYVYDGSLFDRWQVFEVGSCGPRAAP